MSELLIPRTPGAALRMAREKRKLSVAEVVEATRIKTHVIQALEDDDYSTIAAPLYGKGFIKIYAEYLGLDPAPLIQHYLSYYAKTVRPTLKTETPPPLVVNDGIPQPAPLARFKESGNSAITSMADSLATAMRDTLHALLVTWARVWESGKTFTQNRSRFPENRSMEESEPIPAGKFAAIGFAVMVVIILLASGVYFLSGGGSTATPQVNVKEPARRVISAKPLRLAEPPPAPYIKLK